MRRHFIVVGFGTVGRNAVEQLRRAGKQVVCIDKDPGAFEGYDGTYIIGDATRTEVMKDAEISTAATMVTCAGTDAINAFIILEARSLNPYVNILARAEKNENVDKLYMAGADYVMPLVDTAGKMLVRYAVAPHISEFVDRILVGEDMEIADRRIPPRHPLAGKTLMEANLRQRYGITVLSIIREGVVINASSADEKLMEDDILVLLGKSSEITNFLRILTPAK